MGRAPRGGGTWRRRHGTQTLCVFGEGCNDSVDAYPPSESRPTKVNRRILFGDRGNDTLRGGEGVDSVSGGSNADTFAETERLAGEVLDFTAGVDVSV